MNGFESVTRQFIINENTPFIICETYGKIRTNILSATAGSPYQSIVITSQCKSEGKTTTAINLGIMLSRLEKRVLLIDCDLRRSAVHELLRIKNHYGLSSILTGECDIFSGITQNVRNNFHVITSGPKMDNPADILGSSNMERLVRLLYDYYDYIIIDTPPLCIANDALTFRNYTAGLAMIVRDNKTTHADFSTALNTIALSKMKLLGVIRTHCIVKYDKTSDYRSALIENAADPDEEDDISDED